MDIFLYVIVFIIFIINILVIVYIGFTDTSYGKDFVDSNLIRVDTLYHISANKQNLLGYLYLIEPSKYDFISLVNLSDTTPEFNYISAISDKTATFYKFKGTLKDDDNTATTDITTDLKQILQGFTELKHLTNFNAVSLKHSIPVSDYTYYTDKEKKYMQAYLRTYKRLSDNVIYVFCQININTPDNTNYSYLYSLIKIIGSSSIYPKMIVGNFNIHGHEKLFKDVFRDSYHVCPIYMSLTVNNATNGYSAYDGLVVSKKLYNSIKYKIDFSKSDIDRYVLTAQLYQTGIPQVLDVSDYKFKNYVSYLKNNTQIKNNNIGNEGSFDPSKTNAVEIISNNNELGNADPKNYIIYSNNTLNTKINTIEVVKQP